MLSNTLNSHLDRLPSRQRSNQSVTVKNLCWCDRLIQSISFVSTPASMSELVPLSSFIAGREKLLFIRWDSIESAKDTWDAVLLLLPISWMLAFDYVEDEKAGNIGCRLASSRRRFVPKANIQRLTQQNCGRLDRMNSAICERCRYPVDECRCTCPYCGETNQCQCCIGYAMATGG